MQLFPIDTDDIGGRTEGMRRMHRIAGGLLLAMTLIFTATFAVESFFFPTRLPLSLELLRAFSEAAMVGAIADWFAVVALFRHPFGIAIPHTAVIPRKHARIAANIGRFVAQNLLASTAMAQRLEELDPAGRLALWLDRSENSTMIASRLAGILPPALESIGQSRLRGVAGRALRLGIDIIITPPRMAGVLSFAANQNYHQSLLDLALDAVRDFVGRHESFIRGKVSERCGEWIPLWVENKIADSIVGGIGESLDELRKPDHPQRREIDDSLYRFIGQMADSPEFILRLDEIKAQILADPAIETYMEHIWEDFYDQMAGDVSAVETMVLQVLQTLSTRLKTDSQLRNSINHWLRKTIERIMIPRREFIGKIITDLIVRWRTETLVDLLESHVGQDLQYIRINGTIVGGTAGLLIQSIVAALR